MKKHEGEIIHRFQQGDQAAFDELVEEFRKPLYNLAYHWTNNKEDALDICQNAFIKMYKILGRWQPRASLFTWLYRVVINMAIDLGRKKARHPLVPLEGTDPDKPEIEIADTKTAGPFSSARMRELNQNIQQAILKLPPRQQKAFVLRHLEGLSIAEIAQIMRCSAGAVKAHIFQAVRKLRKKLKPLVE